MKLQNSLSRFKSKAKQAGLTLFELIVVIVIMGIIATFAAPQFTGGVTNTAKAKVLYDASNKLSQNWMTLTMVAGTSSAVALSPLLDTGKKAEDILFEGASNVAPAYASSYTSSSILPLRDLAQGTAGAYTIQGYSVAITGGGGPSSPLIFTFTGVPNEIILNLVKDYGSGAASLATSDAAHPVIQYGTDSGDGKRNLTIRKVSS